MDCSNVLGNTKGGKIVLSVKEAPNKVVRGSGSENSTLLGYIPALLSAM